jgi:8-oxo-dGTP pyrophosphatase MutT (NUDIX family)
MFLRRSPNKTTRNSAVLITLFPFENGIFTLLTKRPVYKGPHSGQVSFPGGKFEESDPDLIQTALRETKEEVGIKPEHVEIIGTLTPLFVPVSNLLVYPVVGALESRPELHLNVQEVEYTFMVEINEFKKIENHSVKTICINKIPISAPYYSVCKEDVWGITAMVISEFCELF